MALWPQDLFDAAWDLLALAAECDARGSMEYWRIFDLWNEQGQPAPVPDFIRSEANTVILLPDPKTGQYGG